MAVDGEGLPAGQRPAQWGHRPIVRRKLYELVVDQIVEDVSSGRLQPGERLPTERALADEFTVGRSSIREALRMLETDGVIESAGRGVFAVSRDRNPLNRSLALLVSGHAAGGAELFEVRKMIEVETAALAAERRTDDDIEEMRSALEAMRRGLGSRDEYIGGDVGFHMAVVAASHNRIASHVMQAIRIVMQRILESVYEIPGSPQRSIDQHAQILTAVAAGHADEARERVRDHLLSVEQDIGQALRSDPLSATGREGAGMREGAR
jgi:GntR family transcriptional regulator, transcriptional repressor for pyruvate dehydrogenase complex